MDNTLSKKTSLFSEFDARKLSFVANRIQVFYLDKRGFISTTCQSIWEVTQNSKTSIYELFDAFKSHKEAIEFLSNHSATKKNEGKSLSIKHLEIFFEEETYFVDVLFQKIETQDSSLSLECIIEDKTAYYTSLKQLKEEHKLQEIEFLNEKWQLKKDTDFLEVNHQKELIALDEQLRIDWTNLLADKLKKVVTQSFIQSNLKRDFENLIALSDSFEKISGICLIPKNIKTFLSSKKTFSYLGTNNTHKKLIQNIIQLAGGNFVAFQINENSKLTTDFDSSEIDFIFIEQNFVNNDIKDKNLYCLLVESSFLETEQHLINNKTNLLTYPLYPFQIWQQLLSFTNTNTMSYNEKIDLSQIYEIVDNEPILVQNMLQILDKNLREYPTQLQKEFKNGELDTLRQTVHKFKSCTAYTGLTQFNTTLSEIEASQENGWTIAQIKDKLEFVLQAIPVIKIQVEKKLRELEKEIS